MKLAFWKKDEPLPDLSMDFGAPTDPLAGSADPLGSTMPQLGQPLPDPFASTSNAFSAPMSNAPEPAAMTAPMQTPMQPAGNDDMKMELVLARLDSIRSQLETLNHRLTNIERNQLQPQGEQQRGPWYGQK